VKTARIIYFILLLIISSCDPSTEKDNPRNVSKENDQSPPPGWMDPAAPDIILYDESFVFTPEKKEIYLKKAATVVIIPRRDTIHGISVRSAGQITYTGEEISLSERPDNVEAIYSISYVSTNSYVAVNFDNDIFNNTDYYYTNGVRISYVAPIFSSSPLSFPMLPYRKSSINYSGMTVVQNMYTPTNPDTVNILDGDRPFAAYLYFGHFKNTLSFEKKYRQYSELDIGLIGPGSLGGFVQGQIHDIDPKGWENQVQNDLVLNYTAVVEKGLYNPRFFDLNVFASGQIGTLYDNLGGGFRTRIGKLNPYFAMPGLAKKSSIEAIDIHKWQYGIFAKIKAKLVIYDATLQGGMFNKSSNYTIPASDIERFVLEASAGIYIAYKQLGLTLEQYYISKEFKEAYEFRWGHINITYCF
jgi:hypothetical protein